jgi:putative addiction module killer protein
MHDGSMGIQVEDYIRADQSSPFKRWRDSLAPEPRAKVHTAIFRIRQGNTSNIKWLGDIGEYVIDWGPGYRIYLAREGNTLIILLGGGTKRRQWADIERARKFFQEFKTRKKALGRIPWH